MTKTNPAPQVPPPPALTSAHTEAVGDLHQVKPPLLIPTGWAWLAWLLAILMVAALGFWAWRFWRKRRAQRVPEIIIPPHVRARNRLRAALQIIHEPERFCVLVSDALRAYLEERFDFHAPERTTEEFMEELQASALLSLSQKRSLADFLGRCDLVKFARYEPVETELRRLYEAALQLVEETAATAIATSAAAVATPAAAPA